MGRRDLSRGSRQGNYTARAVGHQVLARVLARPWRTVGIALATAVSLGATFVSAGLAESGAARVSDRFDARRATFVSVETQLDPATELELALTAESRLHQIPGVERTGFLVTIQQVGIDAAGASYPGFIIGGVGGDAAEILGIGEYRSTGLTPYVLDASSEVVLLGAIADEEITARSGSAPRTVGIAGVRYRVEGSFGRADLAPELLLGAVVPFNRQLPAGRTRIVAQVSPGAAQQVADAIPTALFPRDPSAVRAVAPPDPQSLRRDVEADIRALLIVLGATAALVSAVTIGTILIMSNAARIREFGLRRAMGARPKDIRRLVLLEATFVGGLAGFLALSLGLLVLAGLTASRGWTLIVDGRMWLIIPFLGAASGMAGGVIPAIRAARVDPIVALRGL